MADEATTTTQYRALKAEFDAARLAGNHARMAELGPKLWPENVEGPAVRAHPAQEKAAPAVSRAALKARVAELRKAPMLEPAFSREARLAQLEQAQQGLYEPRRSPRP